MYVILNHCVLCSGVENHQAVTITFQSCLCVSVCVRLKSYVTSVFVIPKYAVVNHFDSFLG